MRNFHRPVAPGEENPPRPKIYASCEFGDAYIKALRARIVELEAELAEALTCSLSLVKQRNTMVGALHVLAADLEASEAANRERRTKLVNITAEVLAMVKATAPKGVES